jgi:hypothetical protein
VRVPKAEFLALELETHEVLRDVPLHDVSALDLPGGGDGRTIDDVRALMAGGVVERAGPLARALFSLRRGLGRVFGWDREDAAATSSPSGSRLTRSQIDRSKVAPGTREGLFQLLFVFDDEMLGEIRNATVHAFSCMALRRRTGGYRLYWAIYVMPVSRFTAIYMAMIEPFRRFVVYPSVLGRLRKEWIDSDRNREIPDDGR